MCLCIVLWVPKGERGRVIKSAKTVKEELERAAGELKARISTKTLESRTSTCVPFGAFRELKGSKRRPAAREEEQELVLVVCD